MKMKLLVPLLLMITGLSPAFAQNTTGSDSVMTSMVADISSLESDRTFRLGIMFKMKPGWHIYWKNPGDSGLPTRVEYKLPENYLQGELLWPLPERFTRSGNITDYGYEDRVLLWKNIKVPDSYTPGTEIPVTANVNWVSCKEVCIPGNRKIKSVILPGNSRGINNRDLFDKWQKRLPKKKEQEYTYYTESKSTDGPMTEFQVNLDFKQLYATDLEWFPDPGQKLKVERISYNIVENGSSGTVNFFASLYPGKMLSSPNMDSVLIIHDTEGNKTGFKMPVKVIEVLKKAK